jgi:hypothetical protein
VRFEVPGLTIIDLEPDELARAWPLVRMVSPWLNPAAWQGSAEELIAQGGGVISVVAPDGCLHGVATYEPIDKSRAGRVLYVETLVTFELSRRAPVRQYLCDCLERLAPALGCDAIAVSMPVGGSVPKSWRGADWLAGASSDSRQAPSRSCAPGLLFSSSLRRPCPRSRILNSRAIGRGR